MMYVILLIGILFIIFGLIICKNSIGHGLIPVLYGAITIFVACVYISAKSNTYIESVKTVELQKIGDTWLYLNPISNEVVILGKDYNGLPISEKDTIEIQIIKTANTAPAFKDYVEYRVLLKKNQ